MDSVAPFVKTMELGLAALIKDCVFRRTFS